MKVKTPVPERYPVWVCSDTSAFMTSYRRRALEELLKALKQPEPSSDQGSSCREACP